MDLARAPRRAPLTARKKGSGYENEKVSEIAAMDIGYCDVARSYARTVLERLIDRKLLNYVNLFRVPVSGCVRTSSTPTDGFDHKFCRSIKNCYSITALHYPHFKDCYTLNEVKV
jgi:hypothetical protein